MNTRVVIGFVVCSAVIALSGLFVVADFDQPPNTWVKHSPLADTPTSPRLGYEGACVWDSSHRLFIRYGGHNQGGGGAQYSELWTFDPFTSRWALKEPDTSPPGVCCAQQNVYDPIHRRYVRFPAFSGSHGWQWFREIYLNNSTIWVYDLDVNLWRNLRPLPAPRVSPLRCASWDSDAQVIVVFGGEGNREGTVVYDPHTNTWTRMKPAKEPPFRSAGNMVYDSAHKLHILFGSQFTDDPHTWSYDLRKNEWRDLKPTVLPPTNENDAVLAYDSLNKVVIAVVKVTEGKDENAVHHLQTWAFDAGQNTWTRMNPPQEPDPTGNRSRVLAYASELGLAILENRTRSEPGPPEQQIWTYCFKRARLDSDRPLQPPDNVQVSTTANSAKLTWKRSASTGVTNYIIYRGTGEHPWTVEYRQIASVDARQNGFHDTGLQPGTVYYYAIRSSAGGRLSEGLRRKASSERTPKDCGLHSIPHGIAESEPSTKVRTQPRVVEDMVVSVLSENEVHLAWVPPEVSDVVGYYVERANVEVWTEDQLTRLKLRMQPLPEPAIGAIRRIGQFQRITNKLLKNPSFRDRVSLAKACSVEGVSVLEHRFYDEHLDLTGKPYRFAVFAYRVYSVNALGAESGPSPCIFTIPSAPRWVFAKEDGMICHLKWARNPEQNLKGYRIYRLDGRWDKDPISRMTINPIEDLTFTDSTAGEHSRRYHIVAVDALGQEGFPSAPVWYNREWKRFYEPFTGEWHQ